MKEQISYIDNLDTAWLHPFDAFLSINLIQEPEGKFCEVGVYRGGYLITLLNTLKKLQCVAIDPYPGANDIKKIFLDNLRTHNLQDRVELKASYSSNIDNHFSLIHIDGEHSELAVTKDCNFAIANLSIRGLVVVDDVWHPKFPGIISAVMKIIHLNKLAPFLVSRNKMYLCLPHDYQYFHNYSRSLLTKNSIPFSESLNKGDVIGNQKATFNQSNAINGYELLMIDGISKHNQLKTLGMVKWEVRTKVFRFFRLLVPPLLIHMLKLFLSISSTIRSRRF